MMKFPNWKRKYRRKRQIQFFNQIDGYSSLKVKLYYGKKIRTHQWLKILNSNKIWMELSVRLNQQFVQAKNDLQNVKSENQKLQKQNAMLNEQLKIVQEQLDVMRWEGLMMEMNYETSAFRM